MTQEARQEAHGRGPARSETGDPDLVERFLLGDEIAFNLLVLRYEAPLRSFLNRLVYHSIDAEDLAQETFVRAYQNLHRFRRAASLKTWLFQIALNLARDWHRAQKKSGPGTVRGDRRMLSLAAGEETSTAERFLQKEKQAAVSSALEKLPFQQRAALALKINEGMKYHEIARLLDTSVDSVKSSIHIARKRMAEWLKDCL
ncbi:MAG: sigma-70 family RNA polymerase sigma factor [Planctomycetes bacterium]|nr:sigma-70 family RNA polymerase sigma factor [Planctomycetota bacterium]